MADMSASSAPSEQWICALCTTPARYKCPRCSTPTCSLPCSRKHKQNTHCTGERDKAQYVPMNAYSWGNMMRDYCYLEDVGRKVNEWGDEIVRGGYMENTSAGKAAAGTRKSFSKTKRRPTTGKSKRDIFKAQLETLGVDVDLLPAGMERRNLNQSTFDHKSKRPLLTIEFVFYPPATLNSISSSPPPPYKVFSHRNDLSAALLTVLQRQVAMTLSKSQKQKENLPDWIPSIVSSHPEVPECFVPPHCYIRANTELPHAPNVSYYHQLKPTLSLGELLQGTSFVEFPTIHVFDPDSSSFCGTVIDTSGSIVRVSKGDLIVARALKRRKLNDVVDSKTVSSLVGGYGSDGSSEEETASKHMTGLATLEAYQGSDDESFPATTELEDQSLSSDDEENQPDPARLLELVKQAQNAADEDVLDWGDGWDAEE